MSIDKSISRAPKGNKDKPKLEIEIVDDPAITENEDGSVTVDLSTPTKKKSKGAAALSFDDNLAKKLDEQQLAKLSGDLLADIDADKASRADWEKTLTDGMRLLGLKIEERSEPWPGACGVVHPVLTEAVVRFQSEMMGETFPAAGPVKTKILGKETKEKKEASERVRDDMNVELTDRMPEYRREHERLLWNLPIAGTALKKIYFDPALKRQCSMFVAAEDFIVANGTTDLRTCPRYTQVMKVTPNDLRRSVAAGAYLDPGESIDDPAAPENDSITEAKEKLSGQDSSQGKPTHHSLYECCAVLDIEGLDEGDAPYVITIDKSSGKVLSVRRNWDEKDETREKIQYFVDYHYVPGFGFYSFGLIHLVGGFAESATSILRQLVDAGTLSNLPGGFKTRGLRVKNDSEPLAPGEWRDVDVPSGMLKENLIPLPYKEPSAVLAQLLEMIVDEGRKLAAIAEMKIADFDANSPVGTTMALLERTLKVMTAIQSRIYDSMKYEFRLLKGLVMEHGKKVYEYEPVTGTRDMRMKDFASVDILPVADPNAATMSQRIVQWQAVMQLIQMAPQIYDMPKVHGRMLNVLNIQGAEELIPALKAEMGPRDPVSENMALLQMQPVKAFPMQDHKSHIAVHMAAMQDPMIQQMVGQSPQAQSISAAAYAHVVEHVSMEYRVQIEHNLGTTLPPPDQPLPPEIEYQLSGLIAQASQKLLGQNQAFMQQMQQQAAAQDPIAQQQALDGQTKMREVARKEKKDQVDAQLAQAKLVLDEKKMTGEQSMAARAEIISILTGKEEMSHEMRMKIADHLSSMQEQQAGQQHEHGMADKQHMQGLQQGQMQHQQSMQAGAVDRQHQSGMADKQHQQSMQAGAMDRQHEVGMKVGDQAFQEEQGLQQRAHDSNTGAAEREHQTGMAKEKAKAAPKKPAAKKAAAPKGKK